MCVHACVHACARVCARVRARVCMHAHESWDLNGENYLVTHLLGEAGLTAPELTAGIWRGLGELIQQAPSLVKGEQGKRVMKEAFWIFSQTYSVKFQLQ